MSMRLTAQRTVNATASSVFEFFADASNNPRWQRGMRSCEWITQPPIAVGSRYRQTASFLGRPVISVFEVTDFEPDRMIRIETIESSFPIQVTRRVTPVDAGRCLVTADITGEPPGPGFLAPIMRSIAQRSVDRDYEKLVELLHRGD